MLEGVATLALLEVQREIVSRSSATEGMLLEPLLCWLRHPLRGSRVPIIESRICTFEM